MAGINYVSKEHIALGAGFAGATMLCAYHPPPPEPRINQPQNASYPSVPGHSALLSSHAGQCYVSCELSDVSVPRLSKSAQTQQFSRTCYQTGLSFALKHP